jgi:hypothetical protein
LAAGATILTRIKVDTKVDTRNATGGAVAAGSLYDEMVMMICGPYCSPVTGKSFS